METPFICPDCSAAHADPADAALGHLVLCGGCALALDVLAAQAAEPQADLLAA